MKAVIIVAHLTTVRWYSLPSTYVPSGMVKSDRTATPRVTKGIALTPKFEMTRKVVPIWESRKQVH